MHCLTCAEYSTRTRLENNTNFSRNLSSIHHLIKLRPPPHIHQNLRQLQIDTVGIVTLLGANFIRKSLGKLVYLPFEYFPLLAGQVFADNTITDPVPGFTLYIITEGTMAAELSAWFTH